VLKRKNSFIFVVNSKFNIMKKLLFIGLLTLGISTSVQAQSHKMKMYCTGFTTGFYDGFCYTQAPCYEPVVPVCPTPHRPDFTYMDGYQRGFTQGRTKAIYTF